MKTAEEIVRRALICLAVSDRANLESLDPPSRKKRAELSQHVQAIYNICERQGVLEHMSYNERSFIETPFHKAGLYWAGPFSYHVECINGLLWSVGLNDKIMPYNNMLMLGDVGEVELFCDYEMEDIMKRVHMRSQEEIEQALDCAMLWNWRAVEATIRPGCIGDIRQVIHNTFKGSMDDALAKLPLASEEDHVDMMFDGAPVFMVEADEDDCWVYSRVAEYRQKALEWVLNDLTWEETTADT